MFSKRMVQYPRSMYTVYMDRLQIGIIQAPLDSYAFETHPCDTYIYIYVYSIFSFFDISLTNHAV